MSTGARLVVALAAAGRASAPAWLVLSAVAGVPLAVLAAVLVCVGLAGPFAWAALALSLLLPASAVAHEAGHALAYALLFDRADRPFAIVGLPSVVRPELLRWSLSADRDAAVALAGPAAALALGLPFLVLAPAPWLWMLPFLAHLLSLHPRHPDGIQVVAALIAPADQLPERMDHAHD